jgi:hypothetical protein
MLLLRSSYHQHTEEYTVVMGLGPSLAIRGTAGLQTYKDGMDIVVA